MTKKSEKTEIVEIDPHGAGSFIGDEQGNKLELVDAPTMPPLGKSEVAAKKPRRES